MRTIDRRELLGMGVMALIAPTVRAAEPEPARISGGERAAIHWGETVSGLQAGLRLAHPKAGYKIGDPIELMAYLRNRTSKSMRLIYNQAFYEKTPTVTGPDGKEVRVEGYIDLAAVQVATRVTLPPAETLIVSHPGLWLTTDPPGGQQFPGIPDPKPGAYRIAQNIRYGMSPRERVSLRSQPVTMFSEAGTPHRAEAFLVPQSPADTARSLPTGTVEVTVSSRAG
jgi:hypothetical protein